MNDKIKIMMITPDFPLGGAEIMVEHLTRELVRDGLDVCLVSLYDFHSAITQRLEENNVKIIYLAKRPGLDPRMIFKLYQLYKKEKPDVIHTHRYAIQYAVPAAIMAGVPTKIHTIHNIADKEVGFLKRKINAVFYRYFKVIPVSISPEVTKSIIKEYRLPADQVRMIYNGIDFSEISPKIDYGTQVGQAKVIHIGRFAEQKNHMGLVESFKIVHDTFPDAILKLIGTGDLEALVKSKVKELHLENCVEFLGLKSKVYNDLNEADIFILPSLWEGMPITLIEAMATGLPIVATSVGGVPDMIDDGITGLLVDIDRGKISAALQKLIADRDLRMTLGKAARVASAGFSSQKMAGEYELLYQHAFSDNKQKNRKGYGKYYAEGSSK